MYELNGYFVCPPRDSDISICNLASGCLAAVLSLSSSLDAFDGAEHMPILCELPHVPKLGCLCPAPHALCPGCRSWPCSMGAFTCWWSRRTAQMRR